MTLKEYLDLRGRGTAYRMAKAIGIKPTNLYLWAKKAVTISAYRCAQLELLTGGAVTCEELKPEFDWKTLWSVFDKRNSLSDKYSEFKRNSKNEYSNV